MKEEGFCVVEEADAWCQFGDENGDAGLLEEGVMWRGVWGGVLVLGLVGFRLWWGHRAEGRLEGEALAKLRAAGVKMEVKDFDPGGGGHGENAVEVLMKGPPVDTWGTVEHEYELINDPVEFETEVEKDGCRRRWRSIRITWIGLMRRGCGPRRCGKIRSRRGIRR